MYEASLTPQKKKKKMAISSLARNSCLEMTAIVLGIYKALGENERELKSVHAKTGSFAA